MQVSTKIQKIFSNALNKKVEWNQDKTEFYFQKRVTEGQRIELQAIKQEWGTVTIESTEYEVRVSFPMLSQLPTYFYGIKKA